VAVALRRRLVVVAVASHRRLVVAVASHRPLVALAVRRHHVAAALHRRAVVQAASYLRAVALHGVTGWRLAPGPAQRGAFPASAPYGRAAAAVHQQASPALR
jgi:hypothetical protein